MRPLKLVMSAFGPYIQETTVDFTALGERGLYLITGDTGSGKTTIFDALIFALYGEASGSLREAVMFRSQYAPAVVATFVELTFLYGGRTYTVRRNPEYRRPKDRGEGLTVQRAEATLTYPDGHVVTRTKDVTAAVTELIGLNRSQFMSIAMIAQGDFQKLLMAKTEERGRIFREIFHTGPYLALQEKLKADALRKKAEYEDACRRILQDMENVLLEPDHPCQALLELAKKSADVEIAAEFVRELAAKNAADGQLLQSLTESLETLQEKLDAGHQLVGKVQSARQAARQMEEARGEIARQEALLPQLQAQYEKERKKAADREALAVEIETDDRRRREYQTAKQAYRLAQQKRQQAQESYQSVSLATKDCRARYQAWETQFLDAQAGILAANLSEGQACPVCGSLQHPRLAQLPQTAPTQASLQQEKERLAQLEAKTMRLSALAGEAKARAEAALADLEQRQRQLVSEEELQQKREKKQILDRAFEQARSAYEQCRRILEQNRLLLDRLSEQQEETAAVDLPTLSEQLRELEQERKNQQIQKETVSLRWQTNCRLAEAIAQKKETLAETEREYMWRRALSDTANAGIRGKDRITLETYVQMTFFERIIERANVRLMVMSGGQYELKRKEEAANRTSLSGLELDVTDHYNGSVRSVKTLSGGETFEASLSLALGLADEIQSQAGGIRLDTMFVDEGFGSLDEEALNQAMKALINLAQGNRLVGIISHVSELKERIERQIVVTKDRSQGSAVRIVV